MYPVPPDINRGRPLWLLFIISVCLLLIMHCISQDVWHVQQNYCIINYVYISMATSNVGCLGATLGVSYDENCLQVRNYEYHLAPPISESTLVIPIQPATEGLNFSQWYAQQSPSTLHLVVVEYGMVFIVGDCCLCPVFTFQSLSMPVFIYGCLSHTQQTKHSSTCLNHQLAAAS